MDSPDPPPAPDPMKTAQAQAGMNRDAAVAQQLTNQIDQITPDGSLKYGQTGWNSYVGMDGKTVYIPKFEATQQLSPEQQRIYGINQGTKGQIAQIGNDQARRIGDLLGTPVDLSNDAVEGRLSDLAMKRLNPQLQQQEEGLRARLSSQGLQPGSEAWNAEMQRFDQGRNDAVNQLLLQGRGQAVQEALALRNQPINEISALMSGSQVTQPNFVGTPQASVASPNYMGMVSDNYTAAMNSYGQQVAGQNAMMGGLFGLAGTIGTAGIKYSDRRVKTDIERIGTLPNGLPVYTFRFIWGGPTQIGLMAQEVEQLHPDAVFEIDGIKRVNYAKAVL